MNSLIKSFYDQIYYYVHQYWIDYGDKRVRHYPLFQNGLEYILVIIILYLIIVKFIGPWYMSDKKPYDNNMLNSLIIFYDFSMSFINFMTFIRLLLFHIDYGQRFLLFDFPDLNLRMVNTTMDHNHGDNSNYNNQINTNNTNQSATIEAKYYYNDNDFESYEIFYGYLVYLTRLADLLDTIFFILRKKYKQITFLHVYHHSVVPLIGWMIYKLAPTISVLILFVFINSFIHFIMYLYYGLSLLNSFRQKYRHLLWWKKYITVLQLIQFLVLGFYGCIMFFYTKNFPRFLFWFGFAQNPFFFYMFYEFYRNSYHKNNDEDLELYMDFIHRFASGFRYCFNDYWLEYEDPRTKHFPLISGGPQLIISLLLLYLLFVKLIGPWFMSTRQPYQLRIPMLLYNISMVIVNFYLFIFILKRIDYGRRFLIFKFPDIHDQSPEVLYEIRIGYLCYLTRWIDLLDTIFFVLRKKYKQITFLHLYHHTLVPLIGWMTIKIAPQAPVVGLFLLLNTFIHSVMYLYYALSAFGHNIQKYLWWKKYITQLQLLQFLICGLYGILMVFLQEGFPIGLFWLGFAQNPFFFYMFYDFYRKSYSQRKQQQQLHKENELKSLKLN